MRRPWRRGADGPAALNKLQVGQHKLRLYNVYIAQRVNTVFNVGYIVVDKHLTTWTTASTSRICERNLFPSPSPREAPLTSPAIFDKLDRSRRILLGLIYLCHASSLRSRTGTSPHWAQ